MSLRSRRVYKGSDFMETVIWGGNTESGLYSYISSIAGLLYCVWLVVLGVPILRNKVFTQSVVRLADTSI
jgi:hypothetical protein